MKRAKRLVVFIATLTMALTSITGVAFADIDYSQWNTTANYPSDVSASSPLFPAVKHLIDKKVMTGYPDGTFKPEGYITRAEIAVAVTKMTNRTNNLAVMELKETFSDLAGYGWAKGYINTLVDAGYIKGTSDTTYAPGKNITYAELITILIRTKGGAASELDNAGNWPDNFILYAQTYNLLGDLVVTDWNAPATRGNTARLIYRMM